MMESEPASAPSAEPSPETAPRVRWWPAAVIAAGATGSLNWVWLREAAHEQSRVVGTIVVVGLSTIAAVIWLLLLSRLPRAVRLGAVAVVVVAVLIASTGIRFRGVSGDLVPILEWRWSDAPAELTGPGEAAAAAWTEVSTADVVTHDYPQFQGPARDAVVRGVTLDPDWAESPPVEVWRRPVGAAWSAFVVAGDRAVTQEQHDEEERVVCYALRTGEELWHHVEPTRYATKVGGEGPRATPTIAGDRVFAMGGTGILTCLSLQTGDLHWRADTLAQAGVKEKKWGDACSPLVTPDGLVVVNPGGADGWSLVAYQVADGEVAWHGGSDPASYSSPRFAEIAGRAQIVIFNDGSVVGHDAATGASLWSVPWSKVECVSIPLALDGDRVLVSTGYGKGARLYQVSVTDEGAWSAEELWRSRQLKAKFTDLIERDGVVYGLSDGALSATNLEDGKRLWRGERYGHGQVIAVGDLLIVQAEKGPVALVRIGREGAEELGRLDALSSKTWNPPAFAAPFLLVRNDREAVCYRLALGSE